MSVNTPNEVIDVAVIGGGIAGLWLLNRLIASGYKTVLLSRGALGSGQTIASQGIIHGGLKYTLDGILGSGALSAHRAKLRWRQCLAGQGEINLKPVRVATDSILLWSAAHPYAQLSTALARYLFAGTIKKIARKDHPPFLRQDAFNAQIYRMDDPVVDIISLLKCLATPHAKYIRMLPEHAHLVQHQGRVAISIKTQGAHRLLKPGACILAAGAGNEELLRTLKQHKPRMQRRPLRQLVLNMPNLPSVYAHYLNGGSQPYCTVSSHLNRARQTVWYVGGKVAEHYANGQSAIVLDKLAQIFATASLRQATLTDFMIERAEPRQFANRRPDRPYVSHSATLKNLWTVWPVKLTTTPLLGDIVLNMLSATGVSPSASRKSGSLPKILHHWPQLRTATPPWENTRP